MGEEERIKEEDGFFDTLMEFGVALLGCGAEVSRVEDTLNRLGRAHGALKMHVFVITSCIIVTMTGPDGRSRTQIRRIASPPGTDFSLLESLNMASRRYVAGDQESLQKALEEAKSRGGGKKGLTRLGAVLAAGFFALFFGGTWADALAATGCGIFITECSGSIRRISDNQLIYHLLCAFLSGLLIVVLKHLFPFLHEDMIMIGEIMLLIPGIAMTSSVRDILTGNTISGLLRLTETGTWALALAAGFMLSMWLGGI